MIFTILYKLSIPNYFVLKNLYMRGGLKMTKIMIVDDEPDMRKMVDIMMRKEGFETETAEAGSDFLEKIDEFNTL